ncbi:hypothetical protein KKE06_00580 [Candidatus Micrarchaeota archaeon]|nr:hypothetical protein [Candidatus Micrarchaeota archaeon]MBU1930584.1 hypothetical protein [Candidatus Micrarchaeota archaeon]
MGQWHFFVEAFRLVLKEPKLFLPKLVISIVYGFVMLEIAQAVLQASTLVSSQVTQAMIQEATIVLGITIGLLIVTIIAMIVDIWISSWYPILVSNYHSKKSLSFKRAARESWKRFSVVLPALLGIELVIALILAFVLDMTLFLLPAVFFIPVLIIGFVIIFLVLLAVYPLLSVGVLEKKSIRETFFRSFSLSKKNWKIFSLASILPFSISLVNVGLAFLAEIAAFLVLFWVFRILLAFIVTYNIVVNPSAYFVALEKN